MISLSNIFQTRPKSIFRVYQVYLKYRYDCTISLPKNSELIQKETTNWGRVFNIDIPLCIPKIQPKTNSTSFDVEKVKLSALFVFQVKSQSLMQLCEWHMTLWFDEIMKKVNNQIMTILFKS